MFKMKIKRALCIALSMMILVLCTFPVQTAFADQRYKAFIMDVDDIFTTEVEEELTAILSNTAQSTKCDMGIIIQRDLGGKKPGELTDEILDAVFGKNSDSIVMLLTEDENGFDWISFNGTATDRFSKKQDKIFEAVYTGLSYGYVNAVAEFCGYFGAKDETIPETPSGFQAKLSDLDNCLNDTEERVLLEDMKAAAQAIECHIGVVITADLEGMNETKYADKFADDSFGYGSDNVVLLLCNDHIHTDWISAFGRGTDLFGHRTDRLFDEIYDGLDNHGYYEAVNNFILKLRDYGEGVGDDYYYDYDDDYEYEETDLVGLFMGYVFPFILGLIIALSITNGVSKGYSKKAPVSARTYMDNNRTRFTERSDVFVREYTTSHTVSSSSGGRGGRSGGGGRSRSGRSGGGGRRR